jgi:hypothetical protein
MSDVLPPEWACRLFCERANLNYDVVLVSTKDTGTALRSAVRTGGSLIAKYEEQPVDPLLIEAREICATDCDNFNMSKAAQMHRDGHLDHSPLHLIALAALRRGIEIGKGAS